MPSNKRFLVVDDENEVCNFFSYLLKSKDYEVITANTGEEALARLGSFIFNVALVDLKLPDCDGLSILKKIKETQPECEVIIITGYSTVKSAVEAIQLGAFDYVEKPFVDLEEMENLLEKALHVHVAMEDIARAQEECGFVVGKSPKMLSLLTAAKKIAKKNITVLIQGETGTGKEVLARYIYAMSHRKDRPFLAFNCGAFTETLLESELFGHEKGAFTGATQRKKGIFELAHKGTLFLDEIDSASPAIQIKLLRILETGELIRVGGEEIIKVDVRIITATNANLAAKVEENKFREDLFYRLDVASLFIPPLRKRREDIPLFLNYFLAKEASDKQVQPKKFSEEAMEILCSYPWPGNIRELANTVAQVVLLSQGQVIASAELPQRILQKQQPAAKKEAPAPEVSPAAEKPAPGKPAATGQKEKQTGQDDEPAQEEKQKITSPALFHAHPEGEKLQSILDEFEKQIYHNLELKSGFDLNSFQEDLKAWKQHICIKIITEALEITYGNQSKAARLLNITPRALRYYLKEKSLTNK